MRTLGFLAFAIVATFLSFLAFRYAGDWAFLAILVITLLGLLRHQKPPKFGKKQRKIQ